MGVQRRPEAPWTFVLTADARRVRGVSYGYRLGVLVLRVVLFSVNFLVFLEVLGPLEGLGADLAYVRLERGVDCPRA